MKNDDTANHNKRADASKHHLFLYNRVRNLRSFISNCSSLLKDETRADLQHACFTFYRHKLVKKIDESILSLLVNSRGLIVFIYLH